MCSGLAIAAHSFKVARQRIRRFSRIPNIYNNLGKLLSLKRQLRQLEQMRLGHSFGTVEKQKSASSAAITGY